MTSGGKELTPVSTERDRMVEDTNGGELFATILRAGRRYHEMSRCMDEASKRPKQDR